MPLIVALFDGNALPAAVHGIAVELALHGAEMVTLCAIMNLRNVSRRN
jgi:hypothetical protein